MMGMVYLLCFGELYGFLSRQRGGRLLRGIFMNKPHFRSQRVEGKKLSSSMQKYLQIQEKARGGRVSGAGLAF
jgi:hypothetical protein